MDTTVSEVEQLIDIAVDTLEEKLTVSIESVVSAAGQTRLLLLPQLIHSGFLLANSLYIRNLLLGARVIKQGLGLKEYLLIGTLLLDSSIALFLAYKFG